MVNEPEFCNQLIDNEMIMIKDPEIVKELIEQLEPPLELTLERENKVKEAIRVKHSPPSPKIVHPIIEEKEPFDSVKKL